MPKRLDDNVIIKDVLEVITTSKDISFKNYKKKGKYPESTIISHFKNWTTLLKTLNIEPISNRNISKKEIIEDVLKVIKSTNITTRENYLKHGKYSRTPIDRIFKNWNNLLLELNYDLNIDNRYSKEQIISDYKKMCKDKNKIISAIEFRTIYSQPIIDNVFGSFSNMKKELNLKIDSRFVSDKEIFQNLKNIFNEYGFMSKELIDSFGIVSYPTIIHRFGSVYKAYDIANIPFTVLDNSSKFSKFILSICIEVFGSQYQLEKTFNWLVNPETSQHLYIDIYYPELNLAIEADGLQHYKYCKKFHKSIEDFKYCQRRDLLKNQLLKEHDINLIRIKQRTNINDIRKILSSYSNG